MNGTIFALYFSPTHTSRAIARAVGEMLSEKLAKPLTETDLTLPAARGTVRSFGPEDVLVLGFPVYGGRIPQVLEESLRLLKGDGTPAVTAAVYGNRDFDDSLLEAGDILKAGGFRVAAAGAFIGEHSLTPKVASGRPDGADLTKARALGEKAAEKLLSGDVNEAVPKGSRPYKERGPAAPVAPKTTDACTRCMLCVKDCPMGILGPEDPAVVGEGCLNCFACVKGCPAQAKYFDNERLKGFAAMLEGKCADRKEPEIYL